MSQQLEGRPANPLGAWRHIFDHHLNVYDAVQS